MKKLIKISLCLLFATAFVAQAQLIVDEDFSSYSDGDINGVDGWVASTNGWTNAVVSGELMLDPNGDRIMFSDAAANLDYGDSVQITVDYRLSAQSTRQHGGFFGFGLQTNSVATAADGDEFINTYTFMFGLEQAFRDDGQVNQFPDSQKWAGPGTYVLEAIADYGMNPFGYYTNVAPYDSAADIDPDSDDMRAIYTITKSHVSNEFNIVVSTSNLNSGVTDTGSDTGIVRPAVWESSDLYLTLYSSLDGNSNYIQSVKMEKTVPSASSIPVGVSALGLDNEVSLSWAVAPGATQYEVYRSTTDGVQGALQETVSMESHLDTTASNGTTYYYTIVAKYYNVDSDPSAQVNATPAKIYADEVVYDNDFAANTLGDLATNDPEWSEISGSSNNAFWVIDNGGKKIDTIVTESSFTNSVGNGVYLDRNLANDSDDVIEGYFDVVFTATADGTNDADHTHSVVMSWGLTGSTAEAPDVSKSQMALFAMGIRAESRMCLLFGNDSATDSDDSLVLMSYQEMGWNPKPNWGSTWGGDPNLARDLESDPLRVTWKIRKTRDDGAYQAWASVTNLTTMNSYSGSLEYKVQTRQDAYDSPATLFSLAHYSNAHQDGRFTTLHATIDELNVTHSSGDLPLVEAPPVTSIIAGDRQVTIGWDPVLEATSYTLTLETPSNEVYTVAEEITDTEITDKPRWNDIANSYTLTANFDSDLAPSTASTNFDVAPIGLVSVFHVDGGFGTANMDAATPVVTNGTYMHMDAQTTPFFQNGVDGYTGPTIYGVMQGADVDLDIAAAVQNNGGKMYFGLPTSGWGTYPYAANLSYVEVPDMGTPNADTTFDAVDKTLYVKARWGGWFSGNTGDPNNGCRIAIRNGIDWYVSDALWANGGAGGLVRTVTVGDVAGGMWRPLTINLSSEMTFGAAVDGSTLGLTDVNAIGWFANRMWSAGIYELEVQQLGAKASYDYWAAESGLEEGVNDDLTDDPDDDGNDNETEYAFGGDPLVADTASLPVYDMGIVAHPTTSEDCFTYVYQKQRDPVSGLTYSFGKTADLVFGPWVPAGAADVVEANVDYYWTTVTNYIPIADDVTFMKVDVE